MNMPTSPVGSPGAAGADQRAAAPNPFARVIDGFRARLITLGLTRGQLATVALIAIFSAIAAALVA